MDQILKLIGWTAFCGVKFFFAIPAVVAVGYSFWQTVSMAIVGGLTGFFLFFYFGELLKVLWRKLFNAKEGKVKKKFTKKNRLIINIKGKYGLIGLALLTPSVLSIPLGSILAGRYFDEDRRTIPYMIISIVAWAFVLSIFYHLF